MKTILAICMAISIPSYAMRCGNNLVETGDALPVVISKCGAANFNYSDTLIYKKGNRTIILKFVRDELKDIKWTTIR